MCCAPFPSPPIAPIPHSTLRGSLEVCNFLEELHLANNQLSNLKNYLGFLGQYNYLKVLDLTGNPCTQEQNYRLKVIHAVPSLLVLDRHVITSEERLLAARKYDPAERAKARASAAAARELLASKGGGKAGEFYQPLSKCEKLLLQDVRQTKGELAERDRIERERMFAARAEAAAEEAKHKGPVKAAMFARPNSARRRRAEAAKARSALGSAGGTIMGTTGILGGTVGDATVAGSTLGASAGAGAAAAGAGRTGKRGSQSLGLTSASLPGVPDDVAVKVAEEASAMPLDHEDPESGLSDWYMYQLRKIFDAIDKDKSGTISRGEFKRAMTEIKDSGRKMAEDGSNPDMDVLFDCFDVDGNGNVSIEEFFAAVNGDAHDAEGNQLPPLVWDSLTAYESGERADALYKQAAAVQKKLLPMPPDDPRRPALVKEAFRLTEKAARLQDMANRDSGVFDPIPPPPEPPKNRRDMVGFLSTVRVRKDPTKMAGMKPKMGDESSSDSDSDDEDTLKQSGKDFDRFRKLRKGRKPRMVVASEVTI